MGTEMKLIEGNSPVLPLGRAGNPAAWPNNEMAAQLIINGKAILPDLMEFLRARVHRR